VQDIAVGSVTQILESCIHGRTAASVRKHLCDAARTAMTAPQFAAQLVSSLDSLHYVDKPATRRGLPEALTSTPEMAVTMMLRHGLQGAQSARSHLLLVKEPRMSTAQAAMSGQVTGVLWHLAAFVESVGRIAPVQLMRIVKAPLVAWSMLPPEVRNSAV
jgi:hypothetical protein